MRGQSLAAFERICEFDSAEHFQVRNFCVNDQASVAREFDHKVWFPIAGVLLFAEVAVRAEARCLDDAAKGLLSPSAARLVGVENPAQLLGLARKNFELLSDGANRTGLKGFTLLQAFLRSEEHTSELQSQSNLVCRLLLEKK